MLITPVRFMINESPIATDRIERAEHQAVDDLRGEVFEHPDS